MERSELILRERIQRLLQTYTLEELLEHNELEVEDIIVMLYTEGKMEFPEEPC